MRKYGRRVFERANRYEPSLPVDPLSTALTGPIATRKTHSLTEISHEGWSQISLRKMLTLGDGVALRAWFPTLRKNLTFFLSIAALVANRPRSFAP